MRPLVLTDVGAQIPFYALLALFVVLEQRIRLRSMLNREGERRDQGSLYLLIACIGGGVGGAFVLACDLSTGVVGGTARWMLYGAGLILMVAGIVVRQWAIALLGRFFTVDVRVTDEQVVVDRGPYALVRHPSYTGMLVTFAGIGLALGDWLSLACVLLGPSVGMVVRIRVEEQALREGLGEPYRCYAATRARLVPRVW